MPPALRAPDSHGEAAVALAERSLNDPSAFLELEEVFTPVVRSSTQFRADFTAAAAELAKLGPHGAIERLLA